MLRHPAACALLAEALPGGAPGAAAQDFAKQQIQPSAKRSWAARLPAAGLEALEAGSEARSHPGQEEGQQARVAELLAEIAALKHTPAAEVPRRWLRRTASDGRHDPVKGPGGDVIGTVASICDSMLRNLPAGASEARVHEKVQALHDKHKPKNPGARLPGTAAAFYASTGVEGSMSEDFIWIPLCTGCGQASEWRELDGRYRRCAANRRPPLWRSPTRAY